MQIIICATLALIIGYLLGHARGSGKAPDYYQKEIDKLKEILHVLAKCGDDKNAME